MSFGGLSTMRQLEERQVESPVQLLLWSPKMDILALALQNGEISLYRLNWQKIWSKSPPSEGSCCSSLVWRPDGRSLAAGYESGHVVILEVESGDIVHVNETEGEVSSLSWIMCAESKEHTIDKEKSYNEDPIGQENVWDFLTKFPLLSKAYSSNMDMVDETSDCQKLNDGGPASMLIAGTRKGHVTLFIDGYLLCAKINVNVLMNVNCSIQQVNLAANLSTFSIMCTDRLNENDGTIKLIILSMPLIATCFQELRAVSVKFSILQGTLSYLSETLKQISEAWEGIVVELDTKLESFANKVPQGAMAADFLELLMFGIPSPELEHFLLQELTEKGLKKLIGSIDASYLNVQRLLLKYLNVVAQSLNYFLSELAGLALATDKLEILGITSQKIKEAQKNGSSFWCKGIELQQVIDESRKNFRVFFRWLHGEILKLSDEPVPDTLSKISQQETNFIAEFLANFDLNSDTSRNLHNDEINEDIKVENDNKFSHIHLEKVGQYLKNAELEQVVDRKNNPWHNFLESNRDIKDMDYIIQINEKTSLLQEHESLRTAIFDIFASMNTEMTDKCQYLGELRLHLPSFPSSHLCCRQFASDECKDKIMGLVTLGSKVFDHGHSDEAGTQQLFYYELTTQGKSSHHSIKAAWINFDHPGSPAMTHIDSQFYTCETVSSFLGHSPVSDNQRLVQVPLEQVRPFLRDIPVTSFQPISLRANTPGPLNTISIFNVADQGCHRELENIAACQFDASGPRKVAAFLFRNRKRIRIYDMEVEVDDDEDETIGTSGMSSELNTSS